MREIVMDNPQNWCDINDLDMAVEGGIDDWFRCLQNTPRSKAHCKAEFKDLLAQIKLYQHSHQGSNEYLDFLYTALVTYYVGCLIETDFESKMSKWSSRLFGY